MKRIIYSALAIFSLACLVRAEEAPAISITVITTFDYPGSGNSTSAVKISDLGDITGLYTDSSQVMRGFIRFKNGNFSAPLVDPQDTGGSTQGRGINDSRVVSGGYLDAASGNFHGFFWRGGMFHNFDVPGASWTLLTGLNNAGDFCGSDIPGSGVQSAFFGIGGVITEFTVRDAIVSSAEQINSSNQVCGWYVDSGSVFHGFWRDSNGSLHSVDPTGSVETELFGNNDSNWMVGRYMDGAGISHGLFFVPPNRFVIFDYPGSTFTSFNGINAQGLICGRYVDGSGIQHGILARVRGVPPGQ